MARDYDSQLLESVAVRRRRLRDALLFGSERMRRTHDENLGKTFGSIALAAVLCAGCVGWSFISDRMADGGFGGRGGTHAQAPEHAPAKTPVQTPTHAPEHAPVQTPAHAPNQAPTLSPGGEPAP